MAHEQAPFTVPNSLCLKAIKPSQIPPEHVLISDAQKILETSMTWQAGKIYHDVQTFGYHEYKEDTRTTQSWNCVVSHIRPDERISFKRMWSVLGHNQAWNAKNYVSSVAKVTRVKYISDTQSIWTTLCTYPPPLSPRVFTVYQASWLFEHSHRRRGIVVTLPVDLSSRDTADLAEMEEKGVRGLFVSIEHLQEKEDDIIEWRRISRIDTGGMLPKFWTLKQLPGKMAETNAAFLKWCRSPRSHDEKHISGDEDDHRDAQIGQNSSGSRRRH